MSRFHSNNGLHFERLPDGSVRVAHWMTGTANAGRADQAFVDVLNREWTLDASSWASVVAHVSAQGENGDTWRTAAAFHDKERTS